MVCVPEAHDGESQEVWLRTSCGSSADGGGGSCRSKRWKGVASTIAQEFAAESSEWEECIAAEPTKPAQTELGDSFERRRAAGFAGLVLRVLEESAIGPHLQVRRFRPLLQTESVVKCQKKGRPWLC